MPTGNVLQFLQETLQRLFAKSPRFFKIWGILSGALILITGIPDFLNLFPGVHIPDVWNEKVTIAVRYASSAALFMSLLTSKSTPVGVDISTGTVVKATDATKLPFTAAVEQKSAVKNEVAPVEVKLVSDKPLDTSIL